MVFYVGLCYSNSGRIWAIVSPLGGPYMWWKVSVIKKIQHIFFSMRHVFKRVAKKFCFLAKGKQFWLLLISLVLRVARWFTWRKWWRGRLRILILPRRSWSFYAVKMLPWLDNWKNFYEPWGGYRVFRECATTGGAFSPSTDYHKWVYSNESDFKIGGPSQFLSSLMVSFTTFGPCHVNDI